MMEKKFQVSEIVNEDKINISLEDFRILTKKLEALKNTICVGIVFSHRKYHALLDSVERVENDTFCEDVKSVILKYPRYGGIPLINKSTQKNDCYAFYDQELLDKYLNDEITEYELCVMLGIEPVEPYFKIELMPTMLNCLPFSATGLSLGTGV